MKNFYIFIFLGFLISFNVFGAEDIRMEVNGTHAVFYQNDDGKIIRTIELYTKDNSGRTILSDSAAKFLWFYSGPAGSGFDSNSLRPGTFLRSYISEEDPFDFKLLEAVLDIQFPHSDLPDIFMGQISFWKKIWKLDKTATTAISLRRIARNNKVDEIFGSLNYEADAVVKAKKAFNFHWGNRFKLKDVKNGHLSYANESSYNPTTFWNNKTIKDKADPVCCNYVCLKTPSPVGCPKELANLYYTGLDPKTHRLNEYGFVFRPSIDGEKLNPANYDYYEDDACTKKIDLPANFWNPPTQQQTPRKKAEAYVNFNKSFNSGSADLNVSSISALLEGESAKILFPDPKPGIPDLGSMWEITVSIETCSTTTALSGQTQKSFSSNSELSDKRYQTIKDYIEKEIRRVHPDANITFERISPTDENYYSDKDGNIFRTGTCGPTSTSPADWVNNLDYTKSNPNIPEENRVWIQTAKTGRLPEAQLSEHRRAKANIHYSYIPKTQQSSQAQNNKTITKEELYKRFKCVKCSSKNQIKHCYPFKIIRNNFLWFKK